MWFIWGLICWDIQISYEQSQPDQVSLSLIELCATDIIAVWIACDARDAANKSGLSNEDKKRLRTWNAWGFNGSRNHKLGLSETNNIYPDLQTGCNFCLFKLICLEGVSGRKSACGRNSVSTIGNIAMLYFWGKLIRAELHVIRAETHVIQA
jgi:hypothetical protein